MNIPTEPPENTGARPDLTDPRLPRYINDAAATLALCMHPAAAETFNIHKFCDELELTLAVENIEHDSDTATLLAAQARVLDGLFHFFARKGLESALRNISHSPEALLHGLKAQRQCVFTIDKLKRRAVKTEKPATGLKED